MLLDASCCSSVMVSPTQKYQNRLELTSKDMNIKQYKLKLHSKCNYEKMRTILNVLCFLNKTGNMIKTTQMKDVQNLFQVND